MKKSFLHKVQENISAQFFQGMQSLLQELFTLAQDSFHFCSSDCMATSKYNPELHLVIIFYLQNVQLFAGRFLGGAHAPSSHPMMLMDKELKGICQSSQLIPTVYFTSIFLVHGNWPLCHKILTNRRSRKLRFHFDKKYQ